MKLSAVKLTDSNVAKLKAKEKKFCVWDQQCPGFGVEVTAAGSKLLVVKTCLDGKRSWNTLGRWPMLNVEDARLKAYNLKDEVKNGADPKAAVRARKQAVTVAELADRFIEEHIGAKVTWKGESFAVEIIKDKDGKHVGNKESTAREHIRLIERNIKPILGKMAVKDVGTSEVASLLFKLRRDHPTLSNRVRSVLSKMFAKAELWELRPAGSNPSRGQDRAPERKKERNLNDREIFALGRAIQETEKVTELAQVAAMEKRPFPKPKAGEAKPTDPNAIAALRLAILAGMRKSEIIGDRYRGMPALTWENVDLDAGVLLVHHKTETRTGKKRTVYLCASARALLTAMPRMLGNPHVIPGEVSGQALVNLQSIWVRIRDLVTETAKREAKKAGLKAPLINISDVTIHDLRRTFSSVGARMGYPELWLGGLLGHSASTVTQGYARVNEDPLRVAVEAIGGRIAGLLAGEIDPANEAEEANKEGAKAQG